MYIKCVCVLLVTHQVFGEWDWTSNACNLYFNLTNLLLMWEWVL